MMALAHARREPVVMIHKSKLKLRQTHKHKRQRLALTMMPNADLMDFNRGPTATPNVE